MKEGGKQAQSAPGGRALDEEALDEALDDLEQMLVGRAGDGAPEPAPYDAPAGAAAPVPHGGGHPDTAAPLTVDAPVRSEASGEEERFFGERLSASVAQRLANELEVITQDCLERSLERVAAEVRHRIREHIAIVLPEILEEMARDELESPPDPHEDRH